MKHPYIQFYVGDWLKDPQLSMCSPATRGIWIDLICAIHEGNGTGKLTANRQQLARLCRCTEAEMSAALVELENTTTADIYDADGIVSITCRRIRKARELSLARQQAGSKGAAKTSANREQNPDIDIEDGIDKGTEYGLNKVRSFARENGIPQKDADWFYWKGKGNGWTNGGEPIRDWKATLRSWFRAGYCPSQRQLNTNFNRFDGKKETGAHNLEAYKPVRFAPELTDEQIAKNKEVIAEEKAKLKQKFGMP